jgi:hypothetical protein
MNQPFPTEDDPKRSPAPWEASPFGDNFDAAYGENGEADENGEAGKDAFSGIEDVFSGMREKEEEIAGTRAIEVARATEETDEQPPIPPLSNPSGEAAFPWQSGAPNQRTASSAPLPWENQDSPGGQSYRTQTTPQVPASPPRSSPPKSAPPPKKLTSDLWQKNIPPWASLAVVAAAVLGIGVVVWTNSLPKDPTTGGPPNIGVSKNNTAGAGGGTSGTSIPVRPLRPRVSPGSSPKDAAQPGYVPLATPARPTDPSSENKNVNPSDSTFSAETSAESSTKSPYLSSLEASSAEAAGEGPTDPFSPAYPAPKPPPEPKPAVVAPPPKPQPLPPPPEVIPPVLSLEGVAVEGKTKLAIVRVGDQPLTAEAQVGATIEGWTVTAISDETVTLTKGKQRQVLRLP